MGVVALMGLVFMQAPNWVHHLLLLMWSLVWGACLLHERGSKVLLPPESTPSVQPPVIQPRAPFSPSDVFVVSAPSTPDATEGVPSSSPPPGMTEADPEVLRHALSHDLRAPLRVVDGFTRILKEDYGRVLDKMGHDHLDRVLAASARMNGMIDAILAQAQLSQTPLERVCVDLSALAQEVGHELGGVNRGASEAACGERVAPQFLIQPGLRAMADPLLLRRVLDNLLGNALKYSAKVAQPRIEVGVVPSTNPPVFFVRDNGVGFDMQHAEKLFGLFQRLHSAKEFPGSGVGLAGVQGIIERHGGRVWAEAHSGQGACFYFTLLSGAQAQQMVHRRQSLG